MARKVDPARASARDSAIMDIRLAQNLSISLNDKCAELHALVTDALGGYEGGGRIQPSAALAYEQANPIYDLLRTAAEITRTMDVTVEVPDEDPYARSAGSW